MEGVHHVRGGLHPSEGVFLVCSSACASCNHCNSLCGPPRTHRRIGGGGSDARPDPIPTWQTNGRVLTVLRANGVVYVGGQFTQVMDSSGGTVTPRNRLAAFDASTGALLPWDPDANDTVRALSVSQDASTIFVGGNFTLLNGSPRQRVAEVQAETVGSGTGVVVPGWAPQVDAPVWSTAVLSGQLYIGGEFQHVNGVKRDRVAAINTGSGKLNTVWAPRANKVVRAVLVSPNADKIFIGGYFDSFDGKTLQHLVAVTPNSGALMPWPGRPGGAVKSLAATASSLFAGDAGGGGHVRAYVLSSGKPRWTNTANGDVERVATYQGDVIAGGHFTMMGAFASQHIVALSQTTGKVDPSWTPSADSVHGVFSLLGYGQQFYAGGDFTRWFPGNVAQAHYAEFTTGVSDTTPPTVTGPPKLVVALGTQLGATVIPTRISFLASDNGVSGVCRYQLQKSFASGPYAGVSLPWINAAYAKLQIAPSPKAYRFQLKATDCADNASAFVPGARWCSAPCRTPAARSTTRGAGSPATSRSPTAERCAPPPKRTRRPRSASPAVRSCGWAAATAATASRASTSTGTW